MILHGVLLGLPWPFVKLAESPAPVPVTEDDSVVMDVEIVPKGALTPTEATDTNTPDDEDGTVNDAEEAVERPSSGSTAPASPDEQPAPAADVEPPDDTSEDTPDSTGIDDLPVATGDSGPPPPPPTLDERLQNPGSYNFNGDVSGRAFLDQANWLTKIDQGSVDLDDEQPYDLNNPEHPVKVPYNLGSQCLDPAPHLQASLGLAIDAAGTLVPASLEIISTTGYDVLDEKALEIARTMVTAPGLHDPGKVRAYQLVISVEGYPEDCPP